MFAFLKTIPQFLKLPVYAFDISDFSYKFLLLKDYSDGVRVDKFGEGEIPPGVIQNGEVQDKEKLTQILSEIITKHNIKYVAISLPDEKGFIRFLKLPTKTIKRNEIGKVLGLQLEEHVPLPPNEVVFDYSLLREEKDHFDVVLRAMPLALLETYCLIFKKAGALPVLIDQEMGAVVHAVVPDDFVELGILMDWGKSRTSFAIFNQRIVNFSATVAVGGVTLTNTIAKQLKISFSDAEQFKKTKARVAFDSDVLRSGEIMQAIIPLVTVLREEAEKYIQYWQTHSETSSRPLKMFLTGGDVFISGFVEYLSRELNMPVSLGDSWANVSFPQKYIPELTKHESLRFSCAAGLCLKAMKNNLLF